MFLQKRLKRIRSIYDEYPSQFWVLILGTFIDRLGGALMFPYSLRAGTRPGQVVLVSSCGYWEMDNFDLLLAQCCLKPSPSSVANFCR